MEGSFGAVMLKFIVGVIGSPRYWR